MKLNLRTAIAGISILGSFGFVNPASAFASDGAGTRGGKFLVSTNEYGSYSEEDLCAMIPETFFDCETDFVEFLLNLKLTVSGPHSCPHRQDLVDAADSGCKVAVSFVLSHQLIAETDYTDAVLAAAGYRNVEVIEQILAAKKIQMNGTAFASTLLSAAIAQIDAAGGITLINYVLSAGANPKVPMLNGESVYSQLENRIHSPNYRLVRELLKSSAKR